MMIVCIESLTSSLASSDLFKTRTSSPARESRTAGPRRALYSGKGRGMIN